MSSAFALADLTRGGAGQNRKRSDEAYTACRWILLSHQIIHAVAVQWRETRRAIACGSGYAKDTRDTRHFTASADRLRSRRDPRPTSAVRCRADMSRLKHFTR
jgi:hypothetical protein